METDQLLMVVFLPFRVDSFPVLQLIGFDPDGALASREADPGDIRTRAFALPPAQDGKGSDHSLGETAGAQLRSGPAFLPDDIPQDGADGVAVGLVPVGRTVGRIADIHSPLVQLAEVREDGGPPVGGVHLVGEDVSRDENGIIDGSLGAPRVVRPYPIEERLPALPDIGFAVVDDLFGGEIREEVPVTIGVQAEAVSQPSFPILGECDEGGLDEDGVPGGILQEEAGHDDMGRALKAQEADVVTAFCPASELVRLPSELPELEVADGFPQHPRGVPGD